MTTKVVHCKKEPFDVYIGRPSKWGNPFTHKTERTLASVKVDTIEEAIRAYELSLLRQISDDPGVLETIKSELKGKVLGCWCKPGPCHGDILAKLADMEEIDLS